MPYTRLTTAVRFIMGAATYLYGPKIYAGNVSTGSHKDPLGREVAGFNLPPEDPHYRSDPSATVGSRRLASRFLRWQDVRASRTAHLQRARTLQREMADYATEADRNDFEAVLDRYPDQDTQLLRDFLAAQHVRSGG